MAVNVRYLQKQGLDSATVIGGVGIAVLVGGIMQIALTAVFVVWAGSKARVVKLPSSAPSCSSSSWRPRPSAWCWWSDRPGDSSGRW